METYKPTFLHLAPPLLAFCADNAGVKAESLERLHHIMTAAAPTGRDSGGDMLAAAAAAELALETSATLPNLPPARGEALGPPTCYILKPLI